MPGTPYDDLREDITNPLPQADVHAQQHDLAAAAIKLLDQRAEALETTVLKPPSGGDDLPYLQSAIDFAYEMGGRFLKPSQPGAYLTDGPVVPKDGVYLDGLGFGRSTIKLADGATDHVVKTDRWDTLYGTDGTDCGPNRFGIRGFTIDGNRLGAPGAGKGLAIYGEGYDLDVFVRNCVEEGLHTAGSSLTGFEAPMQAELGTGGVIPHLHRVLAWKNGGGGWLHEGPHDAQAGRVLCWRNNGYNFKASHHGGGLQIDKLHTWGGSGAYNDTTGYPSDFGAVLAAGKVYVAQAEFETCGIAQLLLAGSELQIDQMDVYGGQNAYSANGAGIMLGTVPINVIDATNANPIVIETAVPHGFETNDKVRVAGVGGNTAANVGTAITVIDATHFSLNGIAGNGAYTSGGTVAHAPDLYKLNGKIINCKPAFVVNRDNGSGWFDLSIYQTTAQGATAFTGEALDPSTRYRTNTSGGAKGIGTKLGDLEVATSFVTSNRKFVDADYAGDNTDYIISIGTLTAPRTYTLPQGSTLKAGHRIIVVDEQGGAPTNPITVQPYAGDTVGGGALQITRARGSVELYWSGGAWEVLRGFEWGDLLGRVASLAGIYVLLKDVSTSLTNAALAGTEYLVAPNQANLVVTTTSAGGAPAAAAKRRLKAADYTPPSPLATKLKLACTVSPANGNPNATFTFALKPVSTTTGNLVVGTAVATVAITPSSGNADFEGESADFTFPTDGEYVVTCVPSAIPAVNCGVSAKIQRRAV